MESMDVKQNSKDLQTLGHESGTKSVKIIIEPVLN
jgi:hypothetical protein